MAPHSPSAARRAVDRRCDVGGMGRVGRLGPVAALIRPAFGFGSPKILRAESSRKLKYVRARARSGIGSADRVFPAQTSAAIPARMERRSYGRRRPPEDPRFLIRGTVIDAELSSVLPRFALLIAPAAVASTVQACGIPPTNCLSSSYIVDLDVDLAVASLSFRRDG
jgi:hypothetical protein